MSTKATNRGRARILIDGVLAKTVNLYAETTTARKVVYQTSFSSVGPHTLTVRVVGTAGHPDVDVDAFILLT